MPDYSKMTTDQLYGQLSSHGLARYLERQGLLTQSKLSPLMSEHALIKARDEFQNAQTQGGHAAKIAAYRNIALPLLGRDVPFRKDRTVDDEKWSADMHEAMDLAEKMKLKMHGAEHPQTRVQMVKDPRGREVEITGQYDPYTGKPLGGGDYVSKSISPDTGKIAQEMKDSFRKRDDMKPIFEAQANLNTAKRILNDPERGNNYKDALLITAFSKLEDPAGVVRQQKIAYLEDKSSQLDQLRKKVAHITTDQNATLTQNDRRDIAQAITLLEHGYYDASKTAYDDLVEEADKRGLTPKDILSKQERIAYGYEEGQAAQQPKPVTVSEEKGGKQTVRATTDHAAVASAPVGSATNPLPFTSDEEVKNAPADVEFIVDNRQGKPQRVFHNPNFRSTKTTAQPAAPVANEPSVTAPLVVIPPQVSPSDITPTETP